MSKWLVEWNVEEKKMGVCPKPLKDESVNAKVDRVFTVVEAEDMEKARTRASGLVTALCLRQVYGV